MTHEQAERLIAVLEQIAACLEPTASPTARPTPTRRGKPRLRADRMVTSVPDTYRRENPGFSTEVIEAVQVGERVALRKHDGTISRVYEVVERDGVRAFFRQASRVQKERDALGDTEANAQTN